MTDPLEKAFANLRNPEAELRKEHFEIANKGYLQRKQSAVKRKRKAMARKLIKPENSDFLIDALPAEGELLHCVTCGDFVLGDMVVRLVERIGPPKSLTIATLSMSVKNVESFAAMLEQHRDLTLEILVSHYFRNTNGEIFTAIENLLVKKFPERFAVRIERSHAKLILFDYPGEAYVIETSANLRSSNNIEQMVVSNSRELLNFHRQWIGEVTNG